MIIQVFPQRDMEAWSMSKTGSFLKSIDIEIDEFLEINSKEDIELSRLVDMLNSNDERDIILGKELLSKLNKADACRVLLNIFLAKKDNKWAIMGKNTATNQDKVQRILRQYLK